MGYIYSKEKNAFPKLYFLLLLLRKYSCFDLHVVGRMLSGGYGNAHSLKQHRILLHWHYLCFNPWFLSNYLGIKETFLLPIMVNSNSVIFPLRNNQKSLLSFISFMKLSLLSLQTQKDHKDMFKLLKWIT